MSNLQYQNNLIHIFKCNLEHKDVGIYFYTNQFPILPFCGSYSKPRGARGLNKHYHLRFDPKLGHGICAILRIECACV